MIFVEREEYSLSAWINDLLNIIKLRGCIIDKNSAMMIFVENSADFISMYCEGLKPMQAFLEYEGED